MQIIKKTPQDYLDLQVNLESSMCQVTFSKLIKALFLPLNEILHSLINQQQK